MEDPLYQHKRDVGIANGRKNQLSYSCILTAGWMLEPNCGQEVFLLIQQNDILLQIFRNCGILKKVEVKEKKLGTIN